MGVIGKEQRLIKRDEHPQIGPGPGSYNIEAFKSLSRGELS